MKTNMRYGLIIGLCLFLTLGCQNQQTTNNQSQGQSQITSIETSTETKPVEEEGQVAKMPFPFFENQGDLSLWGIKAPNGEVLVTPQYDMILPSEYDGYLLGYLESKAVIMDSRGTVLVTSNVNDFYEDLETFFQQQELLVPYYDSTLGLYGYKKGETIIINPQYRMASSFRDGYATVQLTDDEAQSTVIDLQGNIMVHDPESVLVNLGKGYIGAIDDLYAYQHTYFKKEVLADLKEADSGLYLPGAYFEILPLDQGGFFVFDGHKGRFLNVSGQALDGYPELENFQNFEKYGDLIKASSQTYEYQHLAYYTQGGQLIWEGETPRVSYQLEEGLEVELSKPIFTLFDSILPISVRVTNNPDAEIAINTLIKSRSQISSIEDEWGMVTSTRFGLLKHHNILTLVGDYYMYGIGAAHPNSSVSYEHYDLLGNKWLQLSDLFLDPQEGLGVIASNILDQIQESEDEMAYWVDESFSVNEDHAFYFDNSGITLVYQPYEIGPYAMGMPSFTVSYEALKLYLDKENPTIAKILEP